MSKIYEIYGYRLNDESVEAQEHRAKAWCPFMGQRCDGGGNRSQSEINLNKPEHKALKEKYPEIDKIMPGVCSLEPVSGQSPWIVCPRRLFVLARQQEGKRTYQRQLENALLTLLNYPTGTRIGVWKEIKLNHIETQNGDLKEFDYTFDYVLMPVGDIPLNQVIPTGTTPDRQKTKLERLGFQLDMQSDGSYTIRDYPHGKPSIVEIMTSSTSGGNKALRTQIPQAFEDAVLLSNHRGPGINYRQVWARMTSQLLVKSEVALGWGGRAIWVVQDVLVDYISRSTGLNMQALKGNSLSEVNILSFSYGDLANHPDVGVVDLPDVTLFSGMIAPVPQHEAEQNPSFIDIVRSPLQPPLTKLISLLTKSGPAEFILTAP